VFEISLERLDLQDATDALARTLLARAAGLESRGWAFPRVFLVQTAPVVEDADPDLPLAEAALDRLLQLGLLEATRAQRLRLHRLLAVFAWEVLEGPAVFASFAPAALDWVVALISEADREIVTEPLRVRQVLDQERPLWEQFLDWGYAYEAEAGACQSARATALLGNYWMISGAQAQATMLSRLDKALVAAKRLADPLAQANTLRSIGEAQQFRKEMEAALESYNQALDLYKVLSERLGEANTLYAIGNVQQFRKEMEAALGSYAQALGLYKVVEGHIGEANTLRAIGEVQQFRKEMEAALGSYTQALDLFREVEDRLGEANTLRAIGNVQHFQGENDAALESYTQALELYQAVGDLLGEANTLQDIGNVQHFQREEDAALESYTQALELFQTEGSHLGEANTLQAIGNVQHFQGEEDAALESYTQALELYQAVGDRLGQANTLQAIGNVQQFQDKREVAQASYSQALDLFRAVGSRLGEANTLAAQSRLWLDSDPSASQAALEAALALRQRLGDAYSMGADLGNYGIALVQRGRGAEALPYLQQARAVFAERGLEAQVRQMEQLIARAQGSELAG
jgi:tetratricopeptide (TPR) repeat protein